MLKHDRLPLPSSPPALDLAAEVCLPNKSGHGHICRRRRHVLFVCERAPQHGPSPPLLSSLPPRPHSCLPIFPDICGRLCHRPRPLFSSGDCLPLPLSLSHKKTVIIDPLRRDLSHWPSFAPLLANKNNHLMQLAAGPNYMGDLGQQTNMGER